ncbi:MAG: hypothetical protein M5U17_03635 [Ignavibacterium sp.]|nr:hypothetical protein [Ignavibacterium sp.]
MSKSNFLSVSLIAIFISITTINLYPQSNFVDISSRMLTENKIDTTQNTFIDTTITEEVSVAGAAILSLLLPGAGLYLTEDYLPATLYMILGLGAYSSAIAFLGTSSEVHIDEGAPVVFLAIAGLIHIFGFFHTLIATIEYNERITPLVTYGGKNIQFGLSIKL